MQLNNAYIEYKEWHTLVGIMQGLSSTSHPEYSNKHTTKQIIAKRRINMNDQDTYFLLRLSSSLSGIFFFAIVGFDRDTGEAERRSRCLRSGLRRGERERERLLRFPLGERDLLRCLCFFLSLPGMFLGQSEKITQ